MGAGLESALLSLDYINPGLEETRDPVKLTNQLPNLSQATVESSS